LSVIISEPQENSGHGYDVIIDLEPLSLDQFCEQYYARLSNIMGFDLVYVDAIKKRLVWWLRETADPDGGTMRVAIGTINNTHVTAYLKGSQLVFQFNSEFVATQHLTDKQERAYRKRLLLMKGAHHAVAKRFAEHLRS
jgi:hypothetical protein